MSESWYVCGLRSTQEVTLEMGQVVTRMAASLRTRSWEEQKYKKWRKILPVSVERDEGLFFYFLFIIITTNTDKN